MKSKSAWQRKAEELADELAKRSTSEELRLVVDNLRDELAKRNIEWQVKVNVLAEHLYTLACNLTMARVNASPDALSCVFLGREDVDWIDANIRAALDAVEAVKVGTQNLGGSEQ